jgi:predicted PolB exonuclease-like 3'-5' exonuclease
MRAWLFQDTKQKAKLGDKCPWSVGWYDPNGKKKSKSIGSKSMAEKFSRKLEGQIASGTYQDTSRASWEQFKAVFTERKLAGMKASTKLIVNVAIRRFERLIKPGKVATINSGTVADFVAKWRKEAEAAEEALSPRLSQ